MISGSAPHTISHKLITHLTHIILQTTVMTVAFLTAEVNTCQSHTHNNKLHLRQKPGTHGRNLSLQVLRLLKNTSHIVRDPPQQQQSTVGQWPQPKQSAASVQTIRNVWEKSKCKGQDFVQVLSECACLRKILCLAQVKHKWHLVILWQFAFTES